MEVYLGQIYLDSRISYSFSHEFQMMMHRELSLLVSASHEFRANFGESSLMLNMSTKVLKSKNAEIAGPAYFPEDKEVEYTLFLPFDFRSMKLSKLTRHQKGLDDLFLAIQSVLDSNKISSSELMKSKERIVAEVTKRHILYID